MSVQLSYRSLSFVVTASASFGILLSLLAPVIMESKAVNSLKKRMKKSKASISRAGLEMTVEVLHDSQSSGSVNELATSATLSEYDSCDSFRTVL